MNSSSLRLHQFVSEPVLYQAPRSPFPGLSKEHEGAFSEGQGSQLHSSSSSSTKKLVMKRKISLGNLMPKSPVFKSILGRPREYFSSSDAPSFGTLQFARGHQHSLGVPACRPTDAEGNSAPLVRVRSRSAPFNEMSPIEEISHKETICESLEISIPSIAVCCADAPSAIDGSTGGSGLIAAQVEHESLAVCFVGSSDDCSSSSDTDSSACGIGRHRNLMTKTRHLRSGSDSVLQKNAQSKLPVEDAVFDLSTPSLEIGNDPSTMHFLSATHLHPYLTSEPVSPHNTRSPRCVVAPDGAKQSAPLSTQSPTHIQPSSGMTPRSLSSQRRSSDSEISVTPKGSYICSESFPSRVMDTFADFN